MPEARLNFVDHPDGSFSCQAVFVSGYDHSSVSHQNVRILERYISGGHEAIPEDRDDEIEAGRPTLETEAFMHFTDEAGGCRLRINAVPKADSSAYRACLDALKFFEFTNKAASDALMTREDGLTLVVGRESINQRNRHA